MTDRDDGLSKLAAKLTVLEIAFGCMLDRWAASTQDPQAAVTELINAVTEQSEKVANLKGASLTWRTDMNECAENFRQMMSFKYPQKPEEGSLN